MKILKVHSNNHQALIGEVSRLIKNGKVIISPTDTIYGLVCNSTSKKAVSRIFEIKKREKNKVLPIFAKDLKMVKKFARVDKRQEKFLKSVWPGKVTVVLKAKSESKKIFPKGIISLEGKIGFRIPKYKLINKLFEKINFPIAETSVNISGKPNLTKIQAIVSQFKSVKNQPVLIVDAGDLKFQRASRVIDLTGQKLKVLRK